MKRFCYLRCSSDIQSTDHQKNTIIQSGYVPDVWYSEDGVSGTTSAKNRPEFQKMMLEAVEGDEVLVFAVDRLGRSAADILQTVELFIEKKIKLRIHAFDNLDITSMYGKVLVQFLAVFAELDRAQIIARCVSGNQKKKDAGVILGRGFTIPPEILENLKIDQDSGMTLNDLAGKYGINRATISRNLIDWGSKLDEYKSRWITFQEQKEERRLSKIAKLQAT